MAWLIFILFACLVLELIAGAVAGSWWSKSLSILTIVILSVDSVCILVSRPANWSIILFYFSLFRVINLIKLAYGRKQIDFLRASFLRSSLTLSIYQLVILGLRYLLDLSGVSHQGLWGVLIALELLGCLLMGASLKRSLVKTRPNLDEDFKEDSQLPALTIAIPARNETNDLNDCLECIVGSKYSKLEILVLDDCSQEKRTPEIIRQFAQSGVRFVEGKTPDDNWSAKNYAYKQLADEANGEVILFCGVDVRFDPLTVRKMVEYKLAKNKTMVSFMPLNELAGINFKCLLLQPMRYLWELALPRRSLNRPPALSTCWLIDLKALKKHGSFEAVSRDIVPERYFARQTALDHDGYSFIAKGEYLGLKSVKSFDEQLATAIRTRYPLVKQRLENVALLSLVELVLFISPIVLFAYELFLKNWWLVTLALFSIILSSAIFYGINQLTYGRKLYLSVLSYPLVFAYDIGLNIYSMFEYEFGEVVWKGRNVCIPVMQVIKNTTLDSG